MPDPQHFPAADLARRTGDVLDAAARAPVTITRPSAAPRPAKR